MKKALKLFVIIFITVTVASGLLIYNYLDNFSNKGDGGGDSLIKPKEVKPGGTLNILLLGVDIGTVGSKGSPKRSDTMIVINYDLDTSEASMVSIPRDTRVMINGSPEKINAANAYGGPAQAIKSVEDLIGIGINYYLEINYQGFRKFVDAIGGIDTVVPYNMDYDDDAQNLHIHFKKGAKVHLDGIKAEKFVRWRKNNDGTGYPEGDIGRIKTQQDFIIKVAEKLKSPSIIPKIPSIAGILQQNIDTNMDPATILKLSKEMLGIDLGSIQKFTLQGESKIINGGWYFVYDSNKSADMVSMLGGKVETGGITNQDIRVQIMNGSGVDGAAAKAREELESKGYTVVGIGNISGMKFTSSHIIDKTLRGDSASKVAGELNISHIEKNQDSISKVDVFVILGTDKS